MIFGYVVISCVVVLWVGLISQLLVLRFVKCSIVVFDWCVLRNLFGLWILRLCCVILKLLVVLCIVFSCLWLVSDSGLLYSSMYIDVVVLCLIWLCSWCNCVRLKCFVCLIIISDVFGMLMFILIIVVVISSCILLCVNVFIMVVLLFGDSWLCMSLILSLGSVVVSVLQVLMVVCSCSVLFFLISGYIQYI